MHVAMDGQLLTAIPKVKLQRLDSRQGLIRGRIQGSEAATGPVLLFLDSHCEVTKGWLEPLLSQIKKGSYKSSEMLIDFCMTSATPIVLTQTLNPTLSLMTT